MEEREPQLGIVIGRKGVGKSWTTIERIRAYVKGNPKAGVKPRRALILDVNDEYTDIPAIALADVALFTYQKKIEVRRVRIFYPAGHQLAGKKMGLKETASALEYILENYKNGLLLVEDMTKYISDSLPNDLIGSLCTQRHVDCDIIIHFQTIGKMANPKIWGNCNWIRFHKADDTVERHKNKIVSSIEPLQILEAMVDTEFYGGNEHFYAYFDKDKGKIKGAYSQKQFDGAIEDYLQKNYNTKVKPEVNRVDLDTGEKKHKTHREAVAQIRARLKKDYYGN